jgi:predicted protein tyrosine phosphatase
MPRLHVSPLSRLSDTVRQTGARHLVTLINVNTPVERPPEIMPDRHLFLGVSDIVTPLDGHVTPSEDHVARLLAFVRAWDQDDPLLIHCWAGISRSTAAAYITACALNPQADEVDLAITLRRAAPSATPNARLVAIADTILGRSGRMRDAIAGIGRGREAFEGEPFEMIWR